MSAPWLAMAEREVEVSAVGAGEIRLRLLGSACDGCAGGCGGRCSLFMTDGDGEFRMSAPAGLDIGIGQRFRLQMDDAGLRRAAWRGYGVAWLGLLLGAGLGQLAGLALGRHGDLLTLVGLLAGTFAAVLLSKRHLPEPRLLPAASAPPSMHPPVNSKE
jgi:hypothetical protein